MKKIDLYDKTFYVTLLIVTVVVTALFIISENGSSDAGIVIENCTFIDPNEAIEQVHQWGWGKIPKQNKCPHCGESSYKRFCTNCKKERGNLPFIGVYCPKCQPDGKYASLTDDLTKICGDCGSRRTWKYVYEDWQNDPNEPVEPNEPDEPNGLEGKQENPNAAEESTRFEERLKMLEERPYIAFESATQSYDSLIYGGPYEIMVIKEGKPEEPNEPTASIVDDGVCIRGDPNEPDCKSCHLADPLLEKETE